MATDFTSATILGSKTSTVGAEKLSLKTSGAIETDVFDSILSNATKSYADKDISSKTEAFKSNNYAKNTKDLNSTKQSQTKTDSKESSQFKETDSLTKKTLNDSKNNKVSDKTQKENIKENTNEAVQNESEPALKNESTKELEKNSVLERENQNFAENKEYSQEQNPNEQKQESTQSEVVNTDDSQKQEQLTSNTITNEQILANIEHAEEPITLATNFAEKLLNLTPETDVANTQVLNEENQQTIVQNTSSVQAEQLQKQPLQKTIVTAEEQNSINNVLKNVVLKQQEQTPSTIIAQATENLANLEVITNAINQASAETSQTEVIAKIQEASTEILQNTEIEIDTKNLTQKTIENLKQEVKQEFAENATVPKTAKESLANDNSRILANIENMTDLVQEEPIQAEITTPMDTAEMEENVQLPRIKATESVAEQAKKQVTTMVENKDHAGEIKSKAVAKLGDLEGTSTVVTEVKTSVHQQQAQTQTNLGQQQNGTLAQNNAIEQAVKLSVEDISATSSSESFLSKLDAKLNASTKMNPAQTMLNKTDIMNQMNAKFNEMLQAGQNKVSVILQPENLGKVSVEIMNSKDGIVAKMTTDSQHVKELFDKNIEALKTSLSSQGVNVNNIKVECTQESANNAMNFEREQFNQNFNNSSNQNNQAHHSKNQETTYSTEYGSTEEALEETEITTETTELKNTETIIKHNGKIDYKV